MALPQDVMRREQVSVPMVGTLAMLGLALAALILRRSLPHSPRHELDDGQTALVAYLGDHLAGADAAIQVVERLKDTHADAPEGTLFAWLHEQLQEDRAVVTALLTELGAPSPSAKRLWGSTTGRVLERIAGGERGDLALFRTLEGLAIGVQGKRCLWRAAQELAGTLAAPGRRSFVELEADAVRQWDAIERFRRSLVPPTFAF